MSTNPVELENKCKLGRLLKQNINIPNYQRGYCWEEKQIKPFLESLWTANRNDPYHLGTIIVHIHYENDNEVWDVVDGQQRLITLSVLQHCLSENITLTGCDFDKCQKAPSLLRCSTSDIDMLWHVHDAAKTINEWVNCHPMDFCALQNFIFGEIDPSVCVTIVKIKENKCEVSNLNRNLPLAWTFFNTINSGGKDLSDYDLLKAHHLRQLAKQNDELSIQFRASRWDSMGEQRIMSLFGDKEWLYETSFANTFYLIRTWLRNRNVCIGKMPADERYSILNHYSALLPLTANLKCETEGGIGQITDGITGGLQFFDWAEHWLWEFSRFCENPIIRRFLQVPWKKQQKHLIIISRSILFYYFCRFGNIYLADACIFILYRIGKLRNTSQKLQAWYGNTDKYIPRTMEALDESPSPQHFFQYCSLPSNRYAPKYDLKNAAYDMDATTKAKVLNGWNHGPDWWKRLLVFSSSSVDDTLRDLQLRDGSIGKSVVFTEQIMNLLNEVAKDFGWKYNEKLKLVTR